MSLANIIALVSQHNVDPTTTPDHDDSPEIVETVIGRNLPKPVRGKIPTDTGEQAAPIHSNNEGKAMVHGLTMPEKGSLDAKGYLLAVRNAGKRPNDKGALVFDKAHERNDLICAIHAYVGYDNRRDFGTQDSEARAKAQRELRGGVTPGPTREEKRSAERSMTGFVKGMPAPQQRMVRDLQARAVSLAESRDKATTALERGQFQVLLNECNKALAELGF